MAAKHYDIIFLATERPDYSGNLFFKYRGYVVVYVPREGYSIEDTSEGWPTESYPTLDVVCATINAMKAIAATRAHVTAIHGRNKSAR